MPLIRTKIVPFRSLYFYLFVLIPSLYFFSLSSHSKDSQWQTNPKGNAVSIDYSAYIENVQKEIKSNWHPPRSTISYHRHALFKIDNNGRLLEVKIPNAPKPLSAMDKASLHAVEKSQPFPPPPGKKEVTIDFSFDYNVRPQVGSKIDDPLNSSLAQWINRYILHYDDPLKSLLSQWANQYILIHDEQTNISLMIAFIVLISLHFILKNISTYLSRQEDKEAIFTDPINKKKVPYQNNILD